MYTHGPQYFQQALDPMRHQRTASDHPVSPFAIAAYKRAFNQAWRQQIGSAVRRQWGGLYDLQQLEACIHVTARRSAGLQVVRLDQIPGSEGRCGEFDGCFRPLQAHGRSRWLSVATAVELGVPLPPVQLIPVGQVYFARDGHNRVSVPQAVGQQSIEAEVCVWLLEDDLDEALRQAGMCPRGWSEVLAPGW